MRARTLLLALATIVPLGYLVVPLLASAGVNKAGVVEHTCDKTADGGTTCKSTQPATTQENAMAYDRADAGMPVLVVGTSGDAGTIEILTGVRYRVTATGDMCVLPQRYGDSWEPVTTCSLTAANVPNAAWLVNASQPEEMMFVQNSNTLAPCPTLDAGAADGSFCGGDGGTLKMAGQSVTGTAKLEFKRLWPQ